MTGVEMATYLLAEHRHRYNHRISVLRRPCFPDLGMYDTWMIDALQILLIANRGIVLFPEWVNTSAFAPTAESFGTVPLHSAALGAAISSIDLSEPFTLTREQAFIAKVMGFPLPPLPVDGEKECALFLRLVLQLTSRKPDFEQMAIEWCKFVKPSDGIFPKLPVYLRQHYAAYERNVRVRDASIAVADAGAALEQLNRATTPAARPVAAAAAAAAQPVAAATEATAVLAHLAPRLPIAPLPHPIGAQPVRAIACATNYALSGAARPSAMVGAPPWPGSHAYGAVALLPQAPAAMRAAALPLLVGDRFVGAQLPAAGERSQPSSETRAVGQRGQDARPRNARTCRSCKQPKATCVGALRGADFCQHAAPLQSGAPAGERTS